MSTLAAVAIGLTLLALALMAFQTVSRGAEAYGHSAEQFDGVLAGRYAFMAFAFGCAVLSGLTWMILAMLLALAGLAFWDAYVYAEATKETDLHVYAGVGALVAFVIYGLSAVL